MQYHSSAIWQNRQLELLKAEIEALLAPLSGEVGLYDLAKEPLAKARRGLCVGERFGRPWPLLPLIVCDSVSRSYEQALPAAATLQLLMAAGDVFDDIEDADSPESLSARYGSAVATNTATTLLILAERATARLKSRGVSDDLVIRVMDAINSFYTTACVGQHLDLSLSAEVATSEDTYLRIISMKSASQIECACHIGALLAEANEDMVGKFSAFGHNLGVAAQITNDIQGVMNGSDIVKHKITLPVIYALAQTDGEARNYLELAFIKPTKSVPDIVHIRDLMFHVGAIHYATVSMELYKQQARDILSEIEVAGISIERSKLFLE